MRDPFTEFILHVNNKQHNERICPACRIEFEKMLNDKKYFSLPFWKTLSEYF